MRLLDKGIFLLVTEASGTRRLCELLVVVVSPVKVLGTAV